MQNTAEHKVENTYKSHAAQQQTVQNHCYLIDEQGKEVHITTSMVQDMCIELLKQCRS